MTRNQTEIDEDELRDLVAEMKHAAETDVWNTPIAAIEHYVGRIEDCLPDENSERKKRLKTSREAQLYAYKKLIAANVALQYGGPDGLAMDIRDIADDLGDIIQDTD